jgi:hypothetical protein
MKIAIAPFESCGFRYVRCVAKIPKSLEAPVRCSRVHLQGARHLVQARGCEVE